MEITSMTTTDQFIAGLKIAEKLTGTSKRQACIRAGVNEVTLRRFINRETSILLVNLDKICKDGYGMTISKVIALGS